MQYKVVRINTSPLDFGFDPEKAIKNMENTLNKLAQEGWRVLFINEHAPSVYVVTLEKE